MGEVCSNDRDSVSLWNIVVERRRILVNPGVLEGKKEPGKRKPMDEHMPHPYCAY